MQHKSNLLDGRMPEWGVVVKEVVKFHLCAAVSSVVVEYDWSFFVVLSWLLIVVSESTTESAVDSSPLNGWTSKKRN